jgi:hypothetical protein
MNDILVGVRLSIQSGDFGDVPVLHGIPSKERSEYWIKLKAQVADAVAKAGPSSE